MPMAEVSRPASDPNPADLALAIAKHAKTLWPAPTTPPAPYYIKTPDAAPAKDTAPKTVAMKPEKTGKYSCSKRFQRGRSWSTAEFRKMQDNPYTYLTTEEHGFAIWRSIANEAELLTIAVHREPAKPRLWK